MRTVDEIQIALIERLKADTALVALLGTADQIKETEWQGAEFTYPAVRVENTVKPNVAYCPPDDVDITIFCLSEKKSSKQCSLIASAVSDIFHNKRGQTSSNGVKFVFSRVASIPYPKQQEGQTIWVSPVEIVAQVN
jgi:hypothetical protein